MLLLLVLTVLCGVTSCRGFGVPNLLHDYSGSLGKLVGQRETTVSTDITGDSSASSLTSFENKTADDEQNWSVPEVKMTTTVIIDSNSDDLGWILNSERTSISSIRCRFGFAGLCPTKTVTSTPDLDDPDYEK